MFVDRSRGHSARFLPFKLALLVVGALTGLVGMLLDIGWMVGLAIGIVASGFALRFVPEPRDREDQT